MVHPTTVWHRTWVRGAASLAMLVALLITQTGFVSARAYPQSGETPAPDTTLPPDSTPAPEVTPTPGDTANPEPTLAPTDSPIEIPTLAPTRAPKTDGEAIRQALASKIGQEREMSLSYMLYQVQVDHLQYSKDRRTALAWLAFVDPETGKNVATEPGLAIAKKMGTLKWKITLQVDPGWATALSKVPAGMIPAGMKKSLLAKPQNETVSAQASQPLTGYRLPWRGGTYNFVTGSVGHVLTYKSCPDTCMYAFDFADGSMFPIYAAKSGRVKFAYSGYLNGNTSNANYLVIEDASTIPTTYMVYYHLAKDSIPPELRVKGAPVNQGQFIALADDTGYSTGHHLHFHVHTNPNSVWGTSVDISFDDVVVNGGRPRTCSEAHAFPQYGSQCQAGDKYLSGNNAGPLPPAPAALAPSGKIRTSFPTFQWSAINGAQQYYLWANQAGAATAAMSILVNAADACQNGACSYTTASALTDASYEFKVRAGSASGWSAFSGVLPFQVYTKPDVPELVSPSGVITINNPAYTWKVAEGATQYYLMVYQNATASYIIYRTLLAANVCHPDGTCSYVSTANVRHGTYQFKVRAGNATGVWSAYSPFMPFKADLAPKPPVLTSPAANEKVTIQRPTYRWAASAGATKYYLRVYNVKTKAYVGSYEASSAYLCAGDLCSFRPSLNLTAGSYTFRVKGYSPAYGYGDYAIQPFTVQLVTDPPETVAPAGTISSDSPAYTWKPVAGAKAYYLMVWDNTAAGWIIYRTLYPTNVCHEDGTCWYVSTAHTESGHSYQWKVRAQNIFGWSAFSPWVPFNMQ